MLMLNAFLAAVWVVLWCRERNQRSSGGFQKKCEKKTGCRRTQVGQSLIVKLTTTDNQRCSNLYRTVSTFGFEGGCEVHTCGQTIQTEGGVRGIWDYIKNIEMCTVF